MYLKICVFVILKANTLKDGVDNLDRMLDLYAAMGVPPENLIALFEERSMLVDELEQRASKYGGWDMGQETKKAFGD